MENNRNAWDDLSIREKAAMIGVAVRNGIVDLQEIRQRYNEFAMGGDTEEELKPASVSEARRMGALVGAAPFVRQKSFIGGDRKQTWDKYWQTDNEMYMLTDSVAREYGINPDLLRYRLNNEGYTDARVKEINNDYKNKTNNTVLGEALFKSDADPRIAGDEFGLDDTADYISEGKAQLINENWGDGDFLNEHGRWTHIAMGNKYSDNIGIMAATLKYFRDLAKKDFPNASNADLDRYAAAYYNRGPKGGREWVKRGAKGYKLKELGGPLMDVAMENVYGPGGYTRAKNNNPISFDEEGSLTDQVTGEKGTIMLPEVVVTGSNHSRVSNIKDSISSIGNIFGDLFYYGTTPFMWAANLLTPTESAEERRKRIHEENIEDKPYTRQIDTVKNDRWRDPSDPVYQSRLGLLGLVPDANAEDIWHLKDDKGNYVKECAKFANHFNSMIGKPTTGDAWTTNGIYGDSIIYGETSNRNKFPSVVNVPRMLSRRVTDIDRDRLETGDIVDLYNPLSPYAQRASREGRGNSHTGRIYKPKGNSGPTYVIHNVNRDIYVDPLGNFTSFIPGKWQITRIARPGTKNKPYSK